MYEKLHFNIYLALHFAKHKPKQNQFQEIYDLHFNYTDSAPSNANHCVCNARCKQIFFPVSLVFQKTAAVAVHSIKESILQVER